jgi:hypothetical protein
LGGICIYWIAVFFLERWAEQKVDLYLRVGLDWVGLG